MIRKLQAVSLDLEASDTRVLSIQIPPGMAKPANLKPGDGVDVLAAQDKDGSLEAVSIRANPRIARAIANNQTGAGPQEKRTAALPTILLRPGQQPGVAAAPPDSPTKLIEQARVVASKFLSVLPNYVCQESITRYVSATRKPDWKVVDMVSAEVVFEDRKESYRKVVTNGQRSQKSPEDSGAWSSGEFGTILGDVFAPASAAEFQYGLEGTIGQQSAAIYDFQVDRRHSAWRIQAPGQYIVPPYQGSVWIDRHSGNTLRIEMQAGDIPKAFPRLTVETAVDYDYLSLGTPEKFLLPVHAEVLSCSRGSSQCERNVIEFRDYHRFAGESTIEFK